MPKQSLKSRALTVTVSYEYSGVYFGALCGPDEVDCGVIAAHTPKAMPSWELGGEWAFLGASSDPNRYGDHSYKDFPLPESTIKRYSLFSVSGTIQESVYTTTTHHGNFADVTYRIRRLAHLKFRLPAQLDRRKPLYFGLADHPSSASSTFGGRYTSQRSPYRDGPWEIAAWWNAGRLRDPTAHAPGASAFRAPVPTPKPAGGNSAKDYVAMGDSYSAGEGLRPYITGSDTDRDTCHRSQSQAYSHYISPAPTLFIACSGQTSAAYEHEAGTGGERPQRDSLSKSVGLVTLTLGGNDLYWTKTLPKCFEFELELPAGLHKHLYATTEACDQDLAGFATRAAAMSANLERVYEQILRDAPNAEVRVLEYPPLFPDRGRNSGKSCRLAGTRIPHSPGQVDINLKSRTEKTVLADQDLANFAIVAAVNWVHQHGGEGAERLSVVDVPAQFGGAKGHTTDCGDKGRPAAWVNPIKFSNSVFLKMADLAVHHRWTALNTLKADFLNSSYHPNHEGQRQMYLALQPSLPPPWH